MLPPMATALARVGKPFSCGSLQSQWRPSSTTTRPPPRSNARPTTSAAHDVQSSAWSESSPVALWRGPAAGNGGQCGDGHDAEQRHGAYAWWRYVAQTQCNALLCLPLYFNRTSVVDRWLLLLLLLLPKARHCPALWALCSGRRLGLCSAPSTAAGRQRFRPSTACPALYHLIAPPRTCQHCMFDTMEQSRRSDEMVESWTCLYSGLNR